MNPNFSSGGKFWSFSFSISPSNEYSMLISFQINWFVLLALQVTLKSLHLHHDSETWILQCSAFYGATLTTIHDERKTVALTIWTSVGKMIPLLFNTLSRFLLAFIPRSKHLLISWLWCVWSTRKEKLPLFPLFPHLCDMKWWDQIPWS